MSALLASFFRESRAPTGGERGKLAAASQLLLFAYIFSSRLLSSAPFLLSEVFLRNDDDDTHTEFNLMCAHEFIQRDSSRFNLFIITRYIMHTYSGGSKAFCPDSGL